MLAQPVQTLIMPSLFQILITIHVAGGTAGLISGTVSAASQKGGFWHKLSGKIFFWGMFSASIAALIISNLPEHKNLFLFAVGGFTLYMICSGYRIVALKRLAKNSDQPITWLDYALSLFGLGFGGYLLFLGGKLVMNGQNFGIVPIVFGLICVNYARLDYQFLNGKQSVKAIWISNHIIRMMGAMIASYTAFLVVNIKMDPEWVLWLLPTLIGSGLIAYFMRKFVKPKSAKTV